MIIIFSVNKVRPEPKLPKGGNEEATKRNICKIAMPKDEITIFSRDQWRKELKQICRLNVLVDYCVVLEGKYRLFKVEK